MGTKGVILATADGGATWTRQASSTGKDLTEVSFADGASGWAAGTLPGIRHTRDGGVTWNRQGTKKLTDITAIAALDGDRCWAISGYPSAIFRTVDGGRHWTALDIGVWQNLEALDFPTADAGWAVGWNGAILRTAIKQK